MKESDLKKVKSHAAKVQSALDKLHESVGASRSPAQKAAMKGKSKKKKDEIKGGEVANRKLAKKRGPGRPRKK